jgi:hypothetical protein
MFFLLIDKYRIKLIFTNKIKILLMYNVNYLINIYLSGRYKALADNY